MKKTDIAYLAGLFDGEGCVRITKWQRRPRHYALRVELEMTNEYIPQLLKFQFGGSVRHTQKVTNGQFYSAWRWQLQSLKAVSFLKALLPYLKLKRPQAELAITFSVRLHQTAGKPLSDKELAVREAEFILMKQMKERGRVSDEKSAGNCGRGVGHGTQRG